MALVSAGKFQFTFRTRLIIFLLVILCYTATTTWYVFDHLIQFFYNNANKSAYYWTVQTEPHSKVWNPSVYLYHALRGPRRCQSASCYIVDVIADPYQPRLFLSMLGLPASDIPSPIRGSVTNVTMVDIRTGEDMVMRQSRVIVNDTHSYALMAHTKEVNVISYCNLMEHHGNTSLGSFYESMTYSCDFDYPIHHLSEKNFRVHVLLAPKKHVDKSGEMSKHALNYVNLNGVDTPFYIDKKGHSGLFNSVSRKPSIMNTQDVKYNSSDHIPRVSACLIGVNYVSPQHREVIQYYISTGFDHIYLGLPLWPDTTLFEESWNLLQDFVMDGNLSIIVSEYAKDFIEPERFGRNFTYAPQGHKSSFVNTCILAARAAGDDLVFVGDMDELIEYKYGNKTTIGEAVMKQLSLRNMTLSQFCAINLGAIGGFYHPDKAGYSISARIENKLKAVGNESDSVATYGKSILNPKRVLRAGLHGVAYCESLMAPGFENITRKSCLDDGEMFRPNINDIRILHLTDSFSQRSRPWMVKLAKEWNQTSYIVRDFSSMVGMELERRDSAKFREIAGISTVGNASSNLD